MMVEDRLRDQSQPLFEASPYLDRGMPGAMPIISWTFSIQDGPHTVELEHNWYLGHRTLPPSTPIPSQAVMMLNTIMGALILVLALTGLLHAVRVYLVD